MPPNTDPWERIESRLYDLDKRVQTLAESIASMSETMKYIWRVEGQVDKLRADMDEAHKVIRQNKMVIDVVKWATLAILPATLSVFGAVAMEVFTK
jgi:DNA-binding ferritin-like protein (Dps family)